MIQLLTREREPDRVRVLIDRDTYVYRASAYHLDKFERLLQHGHAGWRALNYLKKWSTECSKEKRNQNERCL